jgi:hypothetical protein
VAPLLGAWHDQVTDTSVFVAYTGSPYPAPSTTHGNWDGCLSA